MSALTLPEAKQHLTITDATHDDELQATIDAAEAVIAKRVGPLEPTVTTSRVSGDGGCLVLPVSPVVSLTSITPTSGTALTVGNFYVDPESGVIEGVVPAQYFFSMTTTYTVVYIAGRAEVPGDLLYAVKELVKHLWTSQRGGSRRPGSPEDQPAQGYLLPYRVESLLAPHEQVSGFA